MNTNWGVLLQKRREVSDANFLNIDMILVTRLVKSTWGGNWGQDARQWKWQDELLRLPPYDLRGPKMKSLLLTARSPIALTLRGGV